MKWETLSARYQPELTDTLIHMVGNDSLPMYDLIRYHMGWANASGQPRSPSGGKLLRPALCLAACESVGGDWHSALPAAAAIEILHNFTLVHDDIEDGDRERRGIPTVWALWGEAQGINTGDAMHAIARLALLRLEEAGHPPPKVIRAARMLDEACLRLCEGQYLDIAYESRTDIEVPDYLSMIERKTAALFACSVEIGALLGTDNESVIEGLGRFGRNLGLAFQVQDDGLGIWGHSEITGKSSATDILKKKKTLPVIHAMRNADFPLREELFGIYAQQTLDPADLARVLDILESVGAYRYTVETAEKYVQQALWELSRVPIEPPARDQLAALAESLLGRDR